MVSESHIPKKKKLALVTSDDPVIEEEVPTVGVAYSDLQAGQKVNFSGKGSVVEVNPKQQQVLIRCKSGLKIFYVSDKLTFEVPIPKKVED